MLKVLSIRQPWASMIVRGLKRFEIRTWSTPYRGQLIIHASSATPTKALADEVFEEFPELGELMSRVGIASLKDLRALPRSAIVGVVTLVDVLDSEAVKGLATVDDATILDEVDDANFHWLLSNAVEIEPVTGINGKLNLWKLDAPTEKTVLARLSRGAPAQFTSDKKGAGPAEWSDAVEDDEEDDDQDWESSPVGQRLVLPSAAFAAIIGAGPIKRKDVIVKLWSYIKKHGLQDSGNRRMINADARLRKVVGRAKIDMFKLTEKISLHLREAEK